MDVEYSRQCSKKDFPTDSTTNENNADFVHNTNVSVLWKNLRFEVNENILNRNNSTKRRKPILRRLNGHFDRHKLNALMGPSGSGKTTLLNCLSANIPSTSLSEHSEIYHVNSTSTQNEDENIFYFIQQHVHENIIDSLTVWEIFRYAYRFKNDELKHTRESMDSFINQMVDQLMLDPEVLNRKFALCSGGEQKRIAIGQELMSVKRKPAYLLIDEPTTGLDSAAALQVVHCLKRLCSTSQMTVIASIHVPSDEMLRLFDKLYVLAKGGVCIYSGMPIEIASKLRELIQLEIPPQQPPIEALMKLASDGIHSNNSVVQKLADACLAEEYAQLVNLTIQNDTIKLKPICPCTMSFKLVHLYYLSCRFFRQTLFSSSLAFIALLYLVFVLFLCTMFSNSSMTSASGCVPLYSSNDTQSDTSLCAKEIQNEILFMENLNYLCYVMFYVGLVMTSGSSVIFSSNVKILRSEHRNQWYSLGVFFWSSSLVNLLELTIFSLTISSLVYFISGQQAADGQDTLNWTRFLLYAFFMWLLCLYSQYTGQLIGSIMLDHTEFGITLSLIYYVFASMINGFFVDTEQTGNYLVIHGSSLVALKFITRAIFFTIYGFERCDSEREFSFVLQFFHINPDQVLQYIGWIVAYIVTVRIATLCFLYWKFAKFNTRTRRVQTHESQMIPIDWSDNDNSPKKVHDEYHNNKCFIEDSQSRGQILIGWSNLTLFGSGAFYQLTYNNQQNRKQILRNLHGHFELGTLNSLMGASGSGKTSFLKVLNGQLKSDLSRETQFAVNKITQIRTCFVTQEVSSHLWPGLTVLQSMMYSSRLKNRHLSSRQEHEQIANRLLGELGLGDASRTKVEHCSGGELKRLALGLELTCIKLPNLICIDEPFSGLDSSSATTVISTFRRQINKHPLTIVVSVHQPSTELLHLFDGLYVLARGGVCIYSGPPSQIQNKLNSIADLGQSAAAAACSMESKFAHETLINLSSVGLCNAIVQQLAQQEQQQAECNCELSARLRTECHSCSSGVEINRQRFSLYSVAVLSHRQIAIILSQQWKELLFYFVFYLVYASSLIWFYDLGMIDVSGCIDLSSQDACSIHSKSELANTYQVINNTKYNFFLFVNYLSYVMVMSTLLLKRQLVHFKNEHRNGWYSTGSFYLAQFMFELCFIIPLNLLYVYIGNYYEHIHPGIYSKLVLCLTIGAIGIQAVAHIVVTIYETSLITNIALIITLFVLSTLLGNFFLFHQRLHYVYQALSNLSIARFLYESAMLLEYGFGRCQPNEIQSMLYMMSLTDGDLTYCVTMLVILAILFRTIALYSLLIQVNSSEAAGKNRDENLLELIKSMQPVRSINAGIGSSSHETTIKIMS